MLETYMETAEWAADKLRKLSRLEPHAWDRATLIEIAEALTSSPKLCQYKLEPTYEASVQEV